MLPLSTTVRRRHVVNVVVWMVLAGMSFQILKTAFLNGRAAPSGKSAAVTATTDASSPPSSYVSSLSSLYQAARQQLNAIDQVTHSDDTHKRHYHYLLRKKRERVAAAKKNGQGGGGLDVSHLASIPKLRLQTNYLHKNTPMASTQQQSLSQRRLTTQRPAVVVKNPCLPNLLVVGTQKGGTTSFHVYLKQKYHPNFLVPAGSKELDFFNKHMERGKLFREHYLSQFPGIKPYHRPAAGECHMRHDTAHRPYIRTEATPNYLSHPRSAELAKQHLPQAKILIMLRNPVKRLVSAVNMKWQERVCGEQAWARPDCFNAVLGQQQNITRESLIVDYHQTIESLITEELGKLQPCYARSRHFLELDRCMDWMSLDSIARWHQLEDHSHVYRSVYADQVHRWLHHFGRENVRIWSSEEFQSRPGEHMRQLVEWFGLDTTLIDESRLKDQHHTRDYIAPLPATLQSRLRQFFNPHNARLYRLLEKQGYFSVVKQLRKHFDEI